MRSKLKLKLNFNYISSDPDDLLNTTTSDQKGYFRIYGEENEVGNIEPYLKITHSCDNGVIDPRCTITDQYTIPKEYVGRVYDMGIVSLNIAKKKHRKHCEN
uniref:Transthyretin-like family protein n=1 Tax=Parascaris univalens TaxID=6257 RepID=A0A915B7M5_PARUN